MDKKLFDIASGQSGLLRDAIGKSDLGSLLRSTDALGDAWRNSGIDDLASMKRSVADLAAMGRIHTDLLSEALRNSAIQDLTSIKWSAAELAAIGAASNFGVDMNLTSMSALASIAGDYGGVRKAFDDIAAGVHIPDIAAFGLHYHDRFHIPDRSEIGRLAESISNLSVFDKVIAGIGGTDGLASRMASMDQAWVDASNLVSAGIGFTKLQGLGFASDAFAPFSMELGNFTRPMLGDWRDSLAFDEAALVHVEARTTLYRERGFDPSLTDFPDEAFNETLVIAGLLDDDGADEVVGENGFSDVDLEINISVYRRLLRFEIALRAFIVRVMTAAYGENWIKQELPPNMYSQWREKRDKDERAGRPAKPLIDYADFSDYRPIIERGPNWKAVFSKFFDRLEDVRESLQRIQPIRIPTAHARILTSEDKLLVLVETRRIMHAIRRSTT
ncbi:Swt1 family HEPN domain-containing protein [Asticcacaulis biprosthecium]|nr:Swt1 family HEPN domain-containing protein [Asticcacaulis biprosthecium]